MEAEEWTEIFSGTTGPLRMLMSPCTMLWKKGAKSSFVARHTRPMVLIASACTGGILWMIMHGNEEREGFYGNVLECIIMNDWVIITYGAEQRLTSHSTIGASKFLKIFFEIISQLQN